MFAQTCVLRFVAVFAAISPFAVTDEAQAALACGSHDKIVTVLANRFKESRHVMGVVNANAVMEIFMSPQGTWTILVTNTGGLSCITAAGDEWQEVPVTVAGLDS